MKTFRIDQPLWCECRDCRAWRATQRLMSRAVSLAILVLGSLFVWLVLR